MDWYDYIVPAFALSRGGFRLKVMMYDSSGPSVMRTRCLPVNSTYTFTQKYSMASRSVAFDSTKTNDWTIPAQYAVLSSHPVEVQVPQYHKFHSRVNSEGLMGYSVGATVGAITSTPTTPNMFVHVESCAEDFDAGSTVCFRSVADDFQLGYFMCVPPYCIDR